MSDIPEVWGEVDMTNVGMPEPTIMTSVFPYEDPVLGSKYLICSDFVKSSSKSEVSCGGVYLHV